MASAGQSSSRNATCANKEDQQRIKEEIDSRPGDGYAAIDASIRALTRELQIAAFRLVCILGCPNIVVGLAYYNLYDPNDCTEEFLGDTSGLFLVVIGLVLAYFKVFKAGKGISPASHVCALALVQFSLGIVFELLRRIAIVRKPEQACHRGYTGPPPSTHELCWAFTFGFSKAVRMGLFQSCVFSSVILMFTYFNRSVRAFDWKWWQLLLFALSGLLYLVLRATVFGQKRLLPSQWADITQVYPELFMLVTEYAAGFGCPVNAIWGASLWWGLTVDWAHFGGSSSQGASSGARDMGVFGCEQSIDEEDTELTELNSPLASA
jgi:hypothetical protein